MIVEYVGNIDAVFRGRSDEPITLCGFSYIPGLRSIFFSFHKAQQTQIVILDAVSTWKKSRALQTRRQLVCGWGHSFGPQSAVSRLPPQMTDDSPPMVSSMEAARRCRYCLLTAYHRVPRQRKSHPRARLCYFLYCSYNRKRNYHKLLDTETEKVVFSHDVTRHHREAPLILSATVVGNPPAAPPEDIYVPM